MKYLLVLLISTALFSSSCLTEKQWRARFPTDTLRISYDSLVYRDTTIYRTLPGEVVHDSIPFPVNVPGEVNLPPVEAHTSLAYAKAWVKDRQVQIYLQQYDSVFAFKLDSAIQKNYRVDSIFIQQESKPIQLPPKPFFKIGFWIVISLLISTIAGLILRK